jgi:hypothetical protein
VHVDDNQIDQDNVEYYINISRSLLIYHNQKRKLLTSLQVNFEEHVLIDIVHYPFLKFKIYQNLSFRKK